MIIHSNLPKIMKNLLTCLQGNYRDSSGEFCNTTYGVFGAGRFRHVVIIIISCHCVGGTVVAVRNTCNTV